MRLKKTALVGLCLFSGAIYTSTMQPSIVTAMLVAQDADPLGNSSASKQATQQKEAQPTASKKQPRGRIIRPASLATRMSDEARQRLKEPITLNYDEAAWSDVEQDLEARLKLNILLHHSAKDDSLDGDEPITISLSDVPGNHALRLLLQPKNATYVVQAGVVQIISLDDAHADPSFFVRKVFDVGNLLATITSKQLTNLIYKSVGQEQWLENGNGLATLALAGDQLVVFGTETLISDLDELLADLSSKLASD